MASADDVRKLAALARLSIPLDLLEERAREFDRVVSYIGQLDELKVDAQAIPQAGPLRNVFREDGEPTPAGTWTKKLTEQFPKKDGDYLSVKKILSYE